MRVFLVVSLFFFGCSTVKVSSHRDEGINKTDSDFSRSGTYSKKWGESISEWSIKRETPPKDKENSPAAPQDEKNPLISIEGSPLKPVGFIELGGEVREKSFNYLFIFISMILSSVFTCFLYKMMRNERKDHAPKEEKTS